MSRVPVLAVMALHLVLSCPAVLATPPASWHEQKSAHFVVSYQKVPESFVRDVVDAAEERYQQTITMLGFTRYKGWTWDRQVRIMIYDSHAAYARASQSGWSAGQVDPAARWIMTFPSDNGFFDSLLPHELGHIIFHEAVGFGSNIPLWLDEGIAMYQEKARRLGADDDVRELIDAGMYIPLEDLDGMMRSSNGHEGIIRAFYAESASIVGFLISRYEVYRFKRLCAELREGQLFAVALKKAYMELPDLKALERAWRKYLDETRG